MRNKIVLIVSCLLFSSFVCFAQDNDSDGLTNAIEKTLGTDSLDSDTDNDGFLDGQEDANQNGIIAPSETNPLDADTDNDGIGDKEEGLLSLNPLMVDTDNDNLNDGLEMGRTDGILAGTSDFSGIPYMGTDVSWVPDSDPTTLTDPYDYDTDNDGINDGLEDKDHDGNNDATETNPFDTDSDDDGIRDGDEDYDMDGNVDAGETNPLDFDSDDDNLNDGLEIGHTFYYPSGYSDGPNVVDVIFIGTDIGWIPDSDNTSTTNPLNSDTDSDGLLDGVEDTNHNGFVNATESDPNLTDTDYDGSNDGVDCNNINPNIYPGATEIPSDGIDQDCNYADMCYRDADNDGYRPDGTSTVASTDMDCADNYEAIASDPTTDCDDTNASIHPGATEIPSDGKDSNCDGKELCYLDADDDGYRPDESSTIESADCICVDQYEALSSDPTTDCDDTNASIHPGATEIPSDGIDQDCDYADMCYRDADDDGYRPDGTSTVASTDMDCADNYEAIASDPTTDCDDTNASIHPGATELCDGIDKNCDGISKENTISSIDTTACDSYMAPDETEYTTSGIKTAVIPNAAGCDSTITINLTIKNSSSSSIDVSACDSYIAPDETEYTTSGIKTAIIPNAAGCDSTITINLTLNIVDISVTQNTNILTANSTSSTYQWLDCNTNFTLLPYETNQTFTAVINGNYAVEVTQYECVDTSICYSVSTLSSMKNDFEKNILVYPNPTSGVIYIDLKEYLDKIKLTINDANGRVINKYLFTNKKTIEIMFNEPAGNYFIEIISGKKIAHIKFTKI